MLRSLAEDLVKAFIPAGAAGPALPKRIHYTKFRVDNSRAAKQLHDWYVNRQSGLEAIREFVRENFTLPLMNRECPYYYLDNDGCLKKVHYTGRVPDGWGGIPHTHWLEPQTSDAVKEVEALPKPSLVKLHEIIGWPTLEDQWFHKHELEAIRTINHMITPYNDGQATYINIPSPDNFSDFPRVQDQLAAWKKPVWLTESIVGISPIKKLIIS